MADWPECPPQWSGNYILFLQSEPPVNPIPPVSLEKLIEKSSSFPIKFPIESVRCKQLRNEVPKEQLEHYINSSYPVIHEHALYLCTMFLNHQKQFGQHRDFYKDMSLLGFIDRLLAKRAVIFLGSRDYYQLFNECKGEGHWEDVNSTIQRPPLTLENCLSYDEIKLSSFLSVASKSYFINNGDRYNEGVPTRNRSTIAEDGVIMGLIGTRLEKTFVMEYQEIIKSKDQNNHRYGYGNFFVPTLQGTFLNFYGEASLTYDQLKPQLEADTSRYVQLSEDVYFDKLMYAKRLALSIDTLLVEANARAQADQKKAYVHVVGLGLGVWKIWEGQNQVYLDTFAQRLKFLAETLPHVSDVCFAYIHCKQAGGSKHGDRIAHVKVHMEDRNPHAALSAEDEEKLLVVSYPWDGNALPGNEFWLGSLNGSGDPAAAASTQVAELHNWHINGRVCGGNLKVATIANGLMSFEDYRNLQINT